jgi:hypothetical protein
MHKVTEVNAVLMLGSVKPAGPPSTITEATLFAAAGGEDAATPPPPPPPPQDMTAHESATTNAPRSVRNLMFISADLQR